MELVSVAEMSNTCQLTCPSCGYRSVETMPTDACIQYHECAGCHAMLRPKPGDCCVFCSYGSVRCPPLRTQQARGTSSFFERLQSSLGSHDASSLEPLFAEGIQFGSCVGRRQVVDHLNALLHGTAVELSGFEMHPDRAIVQVALISESAAGPPAGRQAHFAVFFVSDDQVIELQFVEDRHRALAAVLNPPPPPPPLERTTLKALAAVLPVRDLAAALEHYHRLGFAVRSYHDGGYGYAERDGVNVHLSVVAGLSPTTTTSAVYLYVEDADSLYAEWRAAGVSGRFFEPHDTAYGLREGAHIDRDGNLIRFGAASRRPPE